MNEWPARQPPASAPLVLPQVELLARELALPHTPRYLRLRSRLFLSILAAFLSLALPLALLASRSIQDGIHSAFAERSLRESQLVAVLPPVVAALRDDLHQQTGLNVVIEEYRRNLGADYVVITDRFTRRLTHPDASQIGQKMVGGDFSRFLKGQSVTETVQGTLGRSVRSKVPVLGQDGQVVGLASVGFLLPRLRDVFWQVVRTSLPWYLGALALALLLADILSRRMQRDMLGLEPEQIASGLRQYRAVIHALEEGVVVVRDGLIHVLNPQARTFLALPSAELPQALPAALENLTDTPTPLELAGRMVLAQVQHAGPDGTQIVTLRDLTRLRALADELTQSQRYAELLRAQTHEFTNRLHTLAGLLQLGETGEALRLIHTQSSRHETQAEAVRRLRHLRLSALMLGKFDRAAELGVQLVLDPLSDVPADLPGTHLDLLELALGNFVENAFEAVSGQPDPAVRVLIGHDPEGLVLEVQDSGPGVPPELARSITQRGVSSKGKNRGVGLALVQARATALHGNLTHDRLTDPHGTSWTRFTLELPPLELPPQELNP